MSEKTNWMPAIAGMLLLGLGVGLMGIYGFFVTPLAKEFDVGVAVINIGPVAMLLVPGFLSPLIGRLADRIPVRRLIFTGIVVAALSMFAISLAPSLRLAALAFIGLTVGLILYGPVVVNGLMVKRYPGLEARALAIAAMGMSVSAVVLPPLVGGLLSAGDWRFTLQVLALLLAVILGLMTFFAIPRGVITVAEGSDGGTTKDIYRYPPFWLIGLCMALGLNVAMIGAVCFPPHFAQQGYSIAEAGWFLSVTGIAGFTGKTVVAWLGDRIQQGAKWLVVGIMLLQIVGLFLLMRADSSASIYAAMLMIGLSNGAFIPMHPFINSRYFDAAVISEVTGKQMPLFLPLGLVGAPMAGYIFDQTGNYSLVFTLMMGIVAVACLLAASLSPSKAVDRGL